jgi:hypothetical protein
MKRRHNNPAWAERRDGAQESRPAKKGRTIDDKEEARQRTEDNDASESLPRLPAEIWTTVLFGEMAPEMVPFALLVCKEWRAFLLSFLRQSAGRGLARRLLDVGGGGGDGDGGKRIFAGASVMLALAGQWRLLVWAVREGILTWGEEVVVAAVRSGSIKTLKRVVRSNCPWDGYPHPRRRPSRPRKPESLAIAEAARAGDIRMLAWLSKRSFRWDAKGRTSRYLTWRDVQHRNPAVVAARHGHVAILQWLAEQGTYIDDDACMGAALLGGHVGVVRWVHLNHRNGRYWSLRNLDADELIGDALHAGNVEVLRFLHGAGAFAIKAESFGTRERIEAWFTRQGAAIQPHLREWLDAEFREWDRHCSFATWHCVYGGPYDRKATEDGGSPSY